MNLHEHQAKQLFAAAGIPVPQGGVAFSVDEAVLQLQKLPQASWVLKAQVHAGGRGKGGGVKLGEGETALREAVSQLLGQRLVTHQTDQLGLPINRVLVEQQTEIAREIYLSLLLDRASRRVAVICSAAGGMNIETVAAESPEKIKRLVIEPAAGLQGYQVRQLVFELQLEKTAAKQLGKLLQNLYDLFVKQDASLIEINPLIVTAEGDLLALDAKFSIDDNALYRHPELAEMRDTTQEDARELEASAFDLNYVNLDGNIGCMVNGAGLAMATMDEIQLHGGRPANFLDVGGGTTAAKVAAAFKLILSDPKVSSILVNIFGGIVRCDLIAEGIISAAREVDLKIPLVVRLEGTNVERGKQLLAESGLDIVAAADLAEGAEKAVQLAGAKA